MTLDQYKQKLKAAIENYNKSTKGSERAWEDFIEFVQTPDLCESQLELIESMWLAKIRLGILTDRMRACGQHELLEEAEMFVSEAEEALADLMKE